MGREKHLRCPRAKTSPIMRLNRDNKTHKTKHEYLILGKRRHIVTSSFPSILFPYFPHSLSPPTYSEHLHPMRRAKCYFHTSKIHSRPTNCSARTIFARRVKFSLFFEPPNTRRRNRMVVHFLNDARRKLLAIKTIGQRTLVQ
jgi:hypothetical protein